ncbi:MAG: hypothetical protein ABIF40_03040 [archaeon]
MVVEALQANYILMYLILAFLIAIVYSLRRLFVMEAAILRIEKAILRKKRK